MSYLSKKLKKVKFLMSSAKKILHLHFSENYRKLKRVSGPREEKFFPVSAMQKSMLTLEKLKNNINAYNITGSIHFKGKLDFQKFQLVLSELVKKHEILRTTFHEKEGELFQKVEKPFPVSIPYFDYQDLDELQKEINYKSYFEELSGKKHALDQLPLFDLAVFQMSAEEFRIVLNFSHLISDGFTIAIFYKEIEKLYSKDISYFYNKNSYKNLQYADYAVWERDYANSFKSQDIEFWRSYLKDVRPIDLNIMKKNHRHDESQKANTLRHPLVGINQKLIAFKKKYNKSSFHVFLATFFMLLYKHSLQDTITLGFPRANRRHPKLFGIYGTFLNTLLVSEKIDPSETFIELLNKLNRNLKEIYQHENIPYGELVRQLKPKRLQNKNPYFDILFNYLSKDWLQTLKLKNIENIYEDMRSVQAELMMTWYMIYDHEDTLVIIAKYSESCFDAAAITQLFTQYDSLLNQVLENPEMALTDYSLLYADGKKEELQQIEDEHRKIYGLEHYQFDIHAKTIIDFPKPTIPIDSSPQAFVHDLITAHANHNSSLAAVQYDGELWTYKDLINTADNICAQLLEKGLQKGDTVAIHGDHSFGMYTSIIGTWKAGGVILMIDPAFPISYKLELMHLAEASFFINLIKDSSFEFSHEMTLNVDPHEVLQEQNLHISIPLQPDDPAYIFFTSGTTGVPKGIKGNHRGLSHFVNWQKDTFNISSADKCAQITAVTFDVVLRSIFTPLIAGATLVIPNKNEGLESGNFFEWVEKDHITLLHIVPTLAEVLLYNPPQSQLSDLRCVFFAGEPLQNHLVKKWRTQVSDQATIINLYGPTETTLAKAYYVVPEEPLEGVQPIGEPITQTQLFIFNRQLKQCGIGEEGEIIIRTPNRTLGYLENVPLEENRFFQNPFSQDPHDLLYKSGDMGYMASDGTIFILGRKDDEVKIHGVRVSPHNVATVIAKVPGVKQCVILFKNAQLIAYIVDDKSIPADDLKNQIKMYLKDRYPNFFTPHAWVFLDSIPTTTRGKVDKKLLPDPQEELATSEKYHEDLNEIETKLLHFCQHELKLNIQSKFESILDMGVDSLDAISFLTYINGEYHVSMKLGDLYKNQTIASIYSWMQDAEKSKENSTHLSVAELSKHVQFDPSSLQSHQGSISNWENPQNIFVTGASGFLGSFLLNDLLKAFPSAHFYCLVRATNHNHAMKKILDKFSYYNLSQQDSVESRVVPLLGDLSKPQLGLTQTEYDFVTQNIDTIYHCGAYVNFLLTFSELYQSNIESINHMIKIASTGQLKAFHYISTAGIFPLSERYAGKIFLEKEADHHPDDILYGGYAQTKWVAERIIDLARANDLPVAVYRPGTISGDSNTGIWQREDAVASFILGCIELGCFPNVSTTLDLAPVDKVSEAIVYISRSPRHLGSIFNMVNWNRVSVQELVNFANNILHKDLKIVEYGEWRKLLTQALHSKSKNSLLPFIPLLPESLDNVPRLKYTRQYDCQNFLRAVEPINQNGDFFPAVDEKLLSNYLNYLLSLSEASV